MSDNTNQEGVYRKEKGVLYFTKIQDFFDVTGVKQVDLANALDITKQQIQNLMRSTSNNGIEYTLKTGDIKIIRPKKNLNSGKLSDYLKKIIRESVL